MGPGLNSLRAFARDGRHPVLILFKSGHILDYTPVFSFQKQTLEKLHGEKPRAGKV